jgi:hypothetical protein
LPVEGVQRNIAAMPPARRISGSTDLAGTARFASLAFVAYLAVAWIVRFDTPEGPHNASIVYPFDTFSMYAEVLPDVASALVVRGADGTIDSVSAFEGLECSRDGATILRDDGALDEGPCTPSTGTSIRYLDGDAAAYLRTHASAGSETVELLRRTWRIPRGGAALAPDDCVVASCRAAR